MPDRFANGNTKNDVVKGLLEHTSSQASSARHGGDLAGMRQHLDYLQQLGVTAVWPTPLLINDMPEQSYHGYAIIRTITALTHATARTKTIAPL